MLKKAMLGLAFCSIGIFDEAISMRGYVANPVSTIVEHYGAMTPQNTMESFKESTEKLLRDIASSKAQYESNDLLRTKWETGIAVLRDVISVSHSSQSDLEALFTRVCVLRTMDFIMTLVTR